MISKRVASALAAVSMMVGVGAAVAGCSPSLDWQCGTYGRPPISVDPSLCERYVPGVRWYSANANNLNRNYQPAIGFPLSNDYYVGDTSRYRPYRSTRTVTVTPTAKSTTSAAKTTTSKSTAKTTAKSK